MMKHDQSVPWPIGLVWYSIPGSPDWFYDSPPARVLGGDTEYISPAGLPIEQVRPYLNTPPPPKKKERFL